MWDTGFSLEGTTGARTGHVFLDLSQWIHFYTIVMWQWENISNSLITECTLQTTVFKWSQNWPLVRLGKLSESTIKKEARNHTQKMREPTWTNGNPSWMQLLLANSLVMKYNAVIPSIFIYTRLYSLFVDVLLFVFTLFSFDLIWFSGLFSVLSIR